MKSHPCAGKPERKFVITAGSGQDLPAAVVRGSKGRLVLRENSRTGDSNAGSDRQGHGCKHQFSLEPGLPQQVITVVHASPHRGCSLGTIQ